MQLFLYEVVARIVAIYLCYDCGCKIWHGLIERKITLVSADLLNCLLDWWTPPQVLHRDTAPVRYWFVMGTQVFAMLACLVVAIIGWQPKA